MVTAMIHFQPILTDPCKPPVHRVCNSQTRGKRSVIKNQGEYLTLQGQDESDSSDADNV
jgi:hypothetical protein